MITDGFLDEKLGIRVRWVKTEGGSLFKVCANCSHWLKEKRLLTRCQCCLKGHNHE